MFATRMSVLYEAAPIPNRLNEDACGVYGDGEMISLFVADGAGQRCPTTKTAAIFERFGPATTAARFASQMVREGFELYYRWDDPRNLLIDVNLDIQHLLQAVYGEVTPEALCEHEPQLVPFVEEDPRLFRLALPVCVATAVQIDGPARRLEYAHAGDTCLLVFYSDGRIAELTSDQMGSHDASALKLAQQVQTELGRPHLADVLDDPNVVDANARSGLYHNYTDKDGQPNPRIGAGVLNGLPELAAYIQRGTLELKDVAGVLVCSDGFLWPAPLDERPDARAARLQFMRSTIARAGLPGYYDMLRAVERSDASRDRFPRFKIHDDCTAVYIEL